MFPDEVVPGTNPDPNKDEGTPGQTKAPSQISPEEYAKAISRAKELEDQHKGLQRKISDLEARRLSEETVARGVSGLQKRFEALEEMVATALPPDSEAATKLKGVRDADKVAQDRMVTKAAEVAQLAQANGITQEQFDSEDYADFRRLWQAGQLEAAVSDFAATTKILKKTAPKGDVKVDDKKDNPNPADIEALAEKRAQELLKTKYGVDPSTIDTKTADGNPNRGKSWSHREVSQMSDEEFEKNFDDISRAQLEGRYKR